MRCDDVRGNLAAYLDEEVDGAPRRAMDEHFSVCAACAGERSAQAAAWRLLDALEAPSSPEGFTDRTLARARASGPVPAGRLLGMPRPAAAAAAALLLAAGGAAVLLPGGDGAPGSGEGAPSPEVARGSPPEALLENLGLLESLDLLRDGDLDVIEGLTEIGDEDLAVLGG